MTVAACHLFQPFVDFVLQYLFFHMAVEAEVPAIKTKQAARFRRMGIVACSAIPPANGAVKNRIYTGQVFMTHVTEGGLGLQHTAQGRRIMARLTFPLSIRVMDHEGRDRLSEGCLSLPGSGFSIRALCCRLSLHGIS
jgi:hypothetical protein